MAAIQQQVVQTATTSKRFSLKIPDWLKGLLIATITTPLTVIYTSIQAGSFTLDWKSIGLMAAGGFLAYIIKNFLSPAQTVITGIQPGTTATVTIPPAGDTTVKTDTKPPITKP